MPAAPLVPEAPPLVLEPSERAPSMARRYLSDRFRELGLADDYVARVVVTELVTNCYRHVGFGRIVVQVFRDEHADLTVIEVSDESTDRPVLKNADHDATSGRGLLLMNELVHDWGVRPLNEEGKTVWARCAR